MGRPPKHDADVLLDAVSALVASGGPQAVTVRRVASLAGAPSGSIYHRFATRDLMVATAWLRAVRAFQAGFLAALGRGSVDEAARSAAMHTPLWAAGHPEDAALLLGHSRAELLARWPDELGAELAAANRPVEQALLEHSRQRFRSWSPGRVRLVRFALVHLPEAAVRAGGDPDLLAEAVGDASLAALRSAPAR